MSEAQTHPREAEPELALRVARLMSRLRLAVVKRIDEQLAPLDLTAAQWGVVVYVAEGLAQTPNDLARAFDYDRGAMSRMLDRLESKDLVKRTPNEDDRRSVRIGLTRRSARLVHEIRPLVGRTLAEMFSVLSTSELQQMEKLLGRAYAATQGA
jgi:DNA-binding MarR family transcriptional regulator